MSNSEMNGPELQELLRQVSTSAAGWQGRLEYEGAREIASKVRSTMLRAGVGVGPTEELVEALKRHLLGMVEMVEQAKFDARKASELLSSARTQCARARAQAQDNFEL